MKKIVIASDHAGYSLKEYVKNFLLRKRLLIKDLGTKNEESVDYPDFGHQVAQDVERSSDKKGIVICGSGNGINMSVNKHKNVRGALCWNEEIAMLARQHNNANILALPARYLSTSEAQKILKTFLNTEFEGGRHERRVNKI